MIGNTCCELWTQNIVLQNENMALVYFAVTLISNFGRYALSFANIFSFTSRKKI